MGGFVVNTSAERRSIGWSIELLPGSTLARGDVELD